MGWSCSGRGSLRSGGVPGVGVLDIVIVDDPVIATLSESVPEEGRCGYEELAGDLESVMELRGEAVSKRLQ